MRALVQLLLFASALISVRGFLVNQLPPSIQIYKKSRSAAFKIWTASQSQDQLSRRAAALLFVAAVAPKVLAVRPVNAQTAQIGWGDAQKAGVKWDGGFSNVLSSQPLDFAVELVNGNGKPVLISFVRPKDWKISTNTGIAIQDYITADSAYVIVCPASEKPAATDAADASELDPSYLLSKVFDINGRYGAFGKIDDVRVLKSDARREGGGIYRYVDFKFSSLSPGGRQIERLGCLKAARVDGDAIILVASARATRWKKVGATIADMLASYAAVPAPQTALKRSGGAETVGNKDAVEGYRLLRYDSPIWRS